MSKQETNSKNEHLLGKMVEGARALYDFFEVIRDNRDASVREVAEQLKLTYNLTDNQGRYLDNVADRTSKAKSIVQYLERRFGINSDGIFQDPQGLHEVLFNKYTPKRLEARSYNFGVGFTQGVWRRNEALGYKHCPVTDHSCFTSPLKKTISRLERGAETDCGNLAFRIPSDSRMGKNAKKRIEQLAGLSENERLVKAIFEPRITPENLKKEVIEHELRHVIDSVINDFSNYGFFSETPSHLYSNSNLAQGLKRDFNARYVMFKERLETAKEGLKKYETIGAPPVIIEGQRKMVDRCQGRLEQHKEETSEQYVLLGKFMLSKLHNLGYKDGLSWEDTRAIMSYLFSTMPREKLVKRVRSLVNLGSNQSGDKN
tara:strand:- start:1326 stop:2444 length:1119 start_codon:yes stop_codon:yes gene_type:complete